MLLKFGVDVLTSEGEKVGELDSVIIDPATEEVTKLIVKKGFLLPHDKLVPISLVADGNEERIKLHAFEGKIEDLQDYEETHYIPVETYIDSEIEGKIIPMVFYSPLSSSRSQATQLTSIPVVKENLPSEMESLEEGMDVMALDDKKVGSVKELIIHPTTDRATHLLIQDGVLFKKEYLIPQEWIKEIDESQIQLYVDSKVIEKLPEYEQEGVFSG